MDDFARCLRLFLPVFAALIQNARRAVLGYYWAATMTARTSTLDRQDERPSLAVAPRSSVHLALLALATIFPWAMIAAPALRLFSDPALPISPVAIAEDANGWLWVAAGEGVFRFDGKNFIKLPGHFNQPAAIGVLGDAILVAGNDGLYVYRNGGSVRVSVRRENAILKLNEDLALVLPPYGDLGPIEAAIWDGTSLHMIEQRGSTALAWQSGDGSLWRVCDSHPCSAQNTDGFRAALRAGQMEQYFQDHAKIQRNVVVPSNLEALLPGKAGTYVARMQFTGMIATISARGVQQQFRVGEFTRANGRPGLYADHAGRVWIPGDDLWQTDGLNVRKFLTPQIETTQVNCVFEDQSGRLWLGLAKHGLAMLGTGPEIESWRTPVALGAISSIIRSDQSTLYAATAKGILLIKRGSGDWEVLPRRESDPPVNQLAPAGPILMGLLRLGPPAEISRDGHVLKEVALDGPDVMPSSLRRMVPESGGSFLATSLDSRHPLFRISGGRMKRLQMPGPDGDTQTIDTDNLGRAWVGFADGICRVEGDVCVPTITAKDGLLDRRVRSLGVRTPGVIWVGYRENIGFSQFRYINGEWTARHFTEKDGYENTSPVFLGVDRRGRVWKGTNNGLTVSDGVHVEPADWLRISEQEGLPSPELNHYGFFEDDDGSVWIGTDRGIARIKPNGNWFAKSGTEKIAGITYGDREILGPSFPNRFLTGSPLSIQIGGVSLFPARYRLLPADKEWHSTSAGRIDLGNLSAGHYQFEVTHDSSENIATYSFDVRLSPAVRLRYGAMIGFPALALGALTWIVIKRSRRTAQLRPLPDLSQSRLEALAPEIHGVIGKTLDGRFIPKAVIARGGFGTVLDGTDLGTRKRCAIKVFRREFSDDWLARRFLQEVAALELISHPNVVRIVGHGSSAAGSPYLVMEFVDGPTLRELLTLGGLPPKTCAALLRQLGSALRKLHARNIFHRDVKPENLMLREGTEVVLIDFSMAIVKDPDKSLHGLSRIGGTLQYMAPEQTLGYVGCESDIYSTAKVFIEMLTGKTVLQLFPNAALDLPDRVREFLPSAPYGLSKTSIDLVAAALEFDPSRRPQDVLVFSNSIAADLERGII